MARPTLEDLIAAWEPILKRAFLEAVYALRDHAHLDQLSAMIERGDIEGALRAVGLDPVSLRPFIRQFEAAFEAGGVAASGALPVVKEAGGFRIVFRFNVRNFAAEYWLKSYSGKLLKDVIEDQVAAVRIALSEGLKVGANPRTTALDLVGRINAVTGRREGGLIGLTKSQAEWVLNYERELRSNPAATLTKRLRDKRFDLVVKEYADAGEAVPQSFITRMVSAYKTRALRFRAEAIARTETMRALHEAQDMAMRQAVDTGKLEQQAVTFIWRSAHDARVRDSHMAMDGQERAMGTPFTSGLGNSLRYPGDPEAPIEDTVNCRCWREPKVDFFAGVK